MTALHGVRFAPGTQTTYVIARNTSTQGHRAMLTVTFRITFHADAETVEEAKEEAIGVQAMLNESWYGTFTYSDIIITEGEE